MSEVLSPRDRATIRSSWVSLGMSCLIVLMKFVAFEMTHSTAVLSDALEGIVNVVAALAAVFVMRAVAEPADEDHPYGHGKLEYFSAAFEGGLIAFASLVIAGEALRSLWNGEALHRLDAGAFFMLGAALLNLLLGLHLKSVGRKYNSEALLASSAHVISDVWTSVAVVIGLGLVFLTGYQWIDSLVALLVALQLGYSGYQILRKSAGALIDEMEPESLKSLSQAFVKHKEPWVIDVHNLKVIRSGNFHHIDSHLVVPEYWDVAKTHIHAHEYEAKIVGTYLFDGEVAFHIDPCARKYCSQCEMSDCAIRLRPFQAPKVLSPESLIQGPMPYGE